MTNARDDVGQGHVLCRVNEKRASSEESSNVSKPTTKIPDDDDAVEPRNAVDPRSGRGGKKGGVSRGGGGGGDCSR